MKNWRPLRNTEPVDGQSKATKRRNLISALIVFVMIFLPVAGLSILALFGVVSPSFNQWFAAFVLAALGVFVDWLL